MNIIGFVGSSRKDGNTAWVVNKILEGAKAQGAETQCWSFSDLEIQPCRGCLCCHKGDNDRGCILNDDMQQLYEALEQADVLVLGSPVYMGQMSAQAKIFTDRLFAHISPRFSPHYKERAKKMQLLLVFTQGNPNASLFQAYFDYTKHIFQLLEFDVQEVVVVPGLRTEPAQARAELHTAMQDLGSSLAAE